MDRCLLDTTAISVVIKPQAKRSASISRNLTQYLRSHSRFTFSEICAYEVLRGLRKASAVVQQRQFLTFCQHSELLPITYDVLDRAAWLWADGRRKGHLIGDNDLIIAATALLHQLPLVTANARHFSWIESLHLADWDEPGK